MYATKVNRLAITAILAGLLLIGCKGHGSSSSIPASLTNWTWEAGTNVANSPGSSGTLGVAATTNQPSGRYGAMGWKDQQGQYWVFSGTGGYSDMWVFNPTSLSWLWMQGTVINTSNAGVYGTLGIAAASNVPGARTSGATWTDSSNNFWMLGGYGTDSNGLKGYMNDLWKFSPGTNQWTWVGGANTGGTALVPYTYPALGVASSSNIPNPRNSAAFWQDTNGNFWLFGGQGYLGNIVGVQNDLWKFVPSTGTWTWVGGASTLNASGNYGTAGTAAATNQPGARQQATTWVDAAGTLWLFGGVGLDQAGGNGYLNDLWKFNTTTGLWTYVNGSTAINAIGNYGTNNVAAVTNVPGARAGAAGWIDTHGNIWLFGGEGINASGSLAAMNDLWELEAASGNWIWYNGSYNGSVPGYYGTVGILSSSNMPGSRAEALTWIDASGNFWLFGGNGYDTSSVLGGLSDVWKFAP